MSYDINQNSVVRPLLFFMTDTADHITGKTGLAPTVTISKNGAAFAAPAGAVTEIASGWYKVAANATDSNTVGPLALHATSAGADPCDLVVANVRSLVDGYTTEQALQLIAAAAIGKTNGASTGREKFYGLDGTTLRATVTVLPNGERVAVVYV